MQYHSGEYTSPPAPSPVFGLRAGQSGSFVAQIENRTHGNQFWAYDTARTIDDIRGQWARIIMEYKFSTTTNGLWRIWFDDVLVFERTGIITWEPTNPFYGHFKFGIYTADHKFGLTHPTNKTVYHDCFRWTNRTDGSYEDVDPNNYLALG